MKKILLLLAACTISQFIHAQCSITLGGQNPPFFVCTSQLPLQLDGVPAGGSFSPTAGVIGNIFNPIGPGSYPVTYTTPAGTSCTQVVVVSAPSQTAQIIEPSSAFFCENDAPFALTGSLGANPAATFLIDGTIATNTFDPGIWGAGPHLIEYTFIDPANGCVSTDDVTINVLPTPDMAFTGLLPQYCLTDAPTALIATNFAPGQSTFSGPGVTGINTFDPSQAGAGIHTITHSYTDFSGICSNSLSVQVEVVDINIIPNFTAIGSICNTGNTDTLVYSGTAIPATYNPVFNWNVADGTITYNGGDTIVVNWPTTGSKDITLNITGVPCLTQQAAQTIDAGGVNIAFEQTSQNACFSANDTLVYTGGQLPNGALLNWAVTGGNILQETGNLLVVQWTSPGEKEVSLGISGLPCIVEPLVQTITVGGVEVSTIENQIIERGTEIELTTTASSSAGTITNFEWTPAATLSCSDCENPAASPQQTTTYAVTATDINGCFASDTVTITVIDDRSVFVPNIFTPNGDGRNDELLIFGKGIAAIDFTIYDRWGAKIYHTTNPDDGWDGTLDGEALNSGVFVYTLSVTFFDGQTQLVTGNVTLVR